MGKARNRIEPPDVEVVTEAQHLDHACATLREAGRFAFDTEFIKEDRFLPVVCLLQAATADRVFLIDPIEDGLDVTPVWDLIADPQVEVVVHAGAEDLSLCQQAIHRPPTRVFDVQVAAGLVGYEYPLSLMRLVRATLGVRLRKSQTLSDWQRRPLSETQLSYAVEDVAYLPAIHKLLERKLARHARKSWANEEVRRLEQGAAQQPETRSALKRIKGTGSLDPRALAAARELAIEREALAAQLNRPVRVVLRDHLLVEIARRGWTQPQEIRTLRGISLNDRALRQLCAAVQRARALPVEECPKSGTAVEELPRESMAISLITAIIRDHCLEHHLAYGLVTSKHDIRTLVVSHVRGEEPASLPPLMRGWRKKAFGPLLTQVLSGQCAVRLTATPDGPGLAYNETQPQAEAE